ncbi:ABC transporter permease [Desulfobacterium sp. N47]
MIISIWNHRKFIMHGAWRDLRHRYAGSSMGFLWNVINPLFQIILYTLVFSRLMPVRIPNMSSSFGFAIYLCAGLIPWIGFSETVNRCTNSFIANANYLRKLAIPEQVFVAQDAGSSFLSLMIGMCLLVIICCVLGHYPSWSWLCLPVILILLQGFGFGIGLFLGVLNVFFRDITQGLGLILQLWFWATPIVYIENVLPPWTLKFLYFNPAFCFIHSLHIIIVNNKMPSIKLWACMLFFALTMPLVGYFVLRKLRPELRDVL